VIVLVPGTAIPLTAWRRDGPRSVRIGVEECGQFYWSAACKVSAGAAPLGGTTVVACGGSGERKLQIYTHGLTPYLTAVVWCALAFVPLRCARLFRLLRIGLRRRKVHVLDSRCWVLPLFLPLPLLPSHHCFPFTYPVLSLSSSLSPSLLSLPSAPCRIAHTVRRCRRDALPRPRAFHDHRDMPRGGLHFVGHSARSQARCGLDCSISPRRRHSLPGSLSVGRGGRSVRGRNAGSRRRCGGRDPGQRDGTASQAATLLRDGAPVRPRAPALYDHERHARAGPRMPTGTGRRRDRAARECRLRMVWRCQRLRWTSQYVFPARFPRHLMPNTASSCSNSPPLPPFPSPLPGWTPRSPRCYRSACHHPSTL